MKEKLGAVLFCLLFAVTFGGVGVFATWMIVTMVHDGLRAGSWVLARANVESLEGARVVYGYSFGGRQYQGSRLGAARIGGSDNIDDWHPSMEGLLADAQAGRRPLMVYVNPDNPAEAMIDRDVRWKLLVFMLPFALAFGGVGAGATWVLVRTLRGKQPERRGIRTAPVAIGSDARGKALGLWIFAFFWNAISIPISLLALPDLIAEERWVGLLVLIFPLVGAFLLWAAIRGTIELLRHGGAKLTLATRSPRIGGALEGAVAFARGVNPGDTVRVTLACMRSATHGDECRVSTRWTGHVDARAMRVADGVRVPFRFEIPAHLPGTTDEGDETFAWRIEVTRPDRKSGLAQGFDVEMSPSF